MSFAMNPHIINFDVTKEDIVEPTTTTIKLRNNHLRFNATITEGGLWKAEESNGTVHHYTAEQVIAVNGVAVSTQSQHTTEEEGEMDYNVYRTIKHYTKKMQIKYPNGADKKGEKFEVTPRYITTKATTRLMNSYMESFDTNKPVNDVFACKTGGYKYHLLINQLVKQGYDFTLMVLHKDDLKKYNKNELNTLIEKCNWAHANGTFSFFLKVDGIEGWGLDFLGLDLKFDKKSAKRAQELFRLCLAFLTIKVEDVKWKIEPFHGQDAELFDGMTVISTAFATQIVSTVEDPIKRDRLLRDVEKGKFSRGSIRFLDELGIGKGDICVRRLLLDSNGEPMDMITYGANVKKELFTVNGEFHITIWEHKPRHLAVWDDQTTVNFPMAFTEAKQSQDLRRILTMVEASLALGTLPNFLEIGQEDRHEDGTPDIEKLSETVRRQWIEWQVAFPGQVKAAQNSVYMGINGIPLRMEGETRGGYFHKMWIPMSNAILAAVCTWESQTEMSGMTFLGRDKDHMFFDPRCGLVISGKRFAETYHLHGGWDLDDTVKVVLIKVWASGDITPYKETFVIDNRIDIPTTKDEAQIMLLLVRSPNGPCEYSIEMGDARGMFEGMEEMLDRDTMVTIDLNDMPVPQDIEVPGLPNTTVYRPNDSMTMADAKVMIKAQLKNPGFGRVCDAMMSYASVKPGEFPEMIVAKTEDIVDATEQGFDLVQFEIIEGEQFSILNQLMEVIKVEDLKMDRAFAATRLPKEYREELRLAGRLEDGRFTRIQKEYRQAINYLKDEMLKHSMEWRAESKVGQFVLSLRLGEPSKVWADDFYIRYSVKVDMAEKAAKADLVAHGGPNAHPFVKMGIMSAKKAANEVIVAEMVKEVLAIEDDKVRYMRVVGLYKTMVKGYKKDRLIFQPAATGALSMMHLLIEGINYFAQRRMAAFLCTVILYI